ncbi:hypothetical protein DV517_71990 [Streptomyces sp. S816]|nr:hypothetical protein DV517_71990 [Streptomyces sp. S816]
MDTAGRPRSRRSAARLTWAEPTRFASRPVGRSRIAGSDSRGPVSGVRQDGVGRGRPVGSTDPGRSRPDSGPGRLPRCYVPCLPPLSPHGRRRAPAHPADIRRLPDPGGRAGAGRESNSSCPQVNQYAKGNEQGDARARGGRLRGRWRRGRPRPEGAVAARKAGAWGAALAFVNRRTATPRAAVPARAGAAVPSVARSRPAARSRSAGRSATATGPARSGSGRRGGVRCGTVGTDPVGIRRRRSPVRRTARSTGALPAPRGPVAAGPVPA